MEFSVLDKQTIQCVMTEKEIADYGMDKKAIYKNDEKVRDFFRLIMQRAEQEAGFRKQPGDVAVHAAFLPNESLEITFCVDHRQCQTMRMEEEAAWEAEGGQTAVLKSKSLAHVMRFCRHLQQDMGTGLYKYRGVYFLLADIRDYDAHSLAALLSLADEYMDGACYTEGIAAFIKEHGECIVQKDAARVLSHI